MSIQGEEYVSRNYRGSVWHFPSQLMPQLSYIKLLTYNRLVFKSLKCNRPRKFFVPKIDKYLSDKAKKYATADVKNIHRYMPDWQKEKLVIEVLSSYEWNMEAVDGCKILVGTR